MKQRYPPAPVVGRVLIGIGLGIIFLLFFGFGGYYLGAGFHSLANDDDAPAIGRRAPDFMLTTVTGESIRLSDLQGTPVMINFWATWCTPCVAEMPLLQDRYDRYKDELIILGINADEPYAQVKAFKDEFELTFDILLDPDATVQTAYRITAYPSSFFVDRDGMIRAVQIGTLSADQLDRHLAKIGVGK